MPKLLDSSLYSVVTTTGSIGVGWKLNFYRSATSTRNATYPTQADALALTNANANPVVIPADGRIPVCWLTDTYAYKGVLTDENDVVKKTVDPLQSVTATGAAYTLEQFGALGTGVSDTTAFNLWRADVAIFAATSPDATATLNLISGKVYGYIDNGFLVNLGLKKLIINANGARFRNIMAAGGGGGFLDTCPLLIGSQGYIDAVTPNLTAKGLAINYTANYLINTATVGSATVTTTTAANAGNFTVGDWVLICSDMAFVGGSPPSMHFFEYAKVLTAVAGTGVITFDGTLLRNTYSATRDNTLISGQFGSRARIFKLHSSWNCDITVNDLIVEAATNYPSVTAFAFGRDIKTNNCRFPGITSSQCDSYVSTDDRFENAANFEPVDKLVASATFKNPRFIGPDISGDGSGGTVRIQGGSVTGLMRPWKNTDLDGFTLGGTASGGLKIGLVQRFRATNCKGPSGPVSFEEAVVLTVDGATITATATTIVVPRSSILVGTTLGQFYGALTIGCRIDVVSDTTVDAWATGPFAIVTSITDSGANVVIGVNYSGGVLIPAATVFRAPRLLAFLGTGNMGAGALANNTSPQSITGIPNGGLNVIRGNFRTMMIAPETGGSYGTATMPVNGIPKRIWARVLRAYTGATHATLGLEILGVQPTAAQYERIDLKTVGVREATRSVATAALGADTWAVLPATYTGRLNVVINVAAAGAAAALNEATQLLPMVELLLEFEDVAHDVAVAS